MNRQLLKVYDVGYSQLLNDLKEFDTKVSIPLFMSVSDDYPKSKKRLMFIGQETKGWGNHRKGKTLNYHAN